MSRALILSCSRYKRPDQHPLPAIERYDGPAFRVLRRYLRESDSRPPAVRIISAEFGLIAPEEQVGPYDRRMTADRAKELEPAVTAAFEPFCRSSQIDDLMVLASEVYSATMAKCWSMLGDDVEVHMPSGSIGRRVSELRDWLYGGPPAGARVTVTGQVKFRGKEITATGEQILDLARRQLSSDGGKASRFESWCVAVDERLVAPKWLVSKLSGVPVGEFRTADALNVLRKLGVEVRRVPSNGHEQNVAKELSRCS